MGAVCPESLREFVSEENIDKRDMWLYHTKTNNGLGRELMDITAEFAEKLFGEFGDFDDWYFKMRYVQYEWVRVSLGNARSKAWFNSGIIYWMLNDCWPAACGWSLLDYYTRPKAGFYAMKKFGQNGSVYITKEAGGYSVNITNILESTNDVDLIVGVVNLSDNTYREVKRESLSVPSGHVSVGAQASLSPSEVLIAEISDGEISQRDWYKEGLPKLCKSGDISWQINGDEITVRSDSYIHVVEIECDGIIEDNYFSLLPGERRSLGIGSANVTAVRAFTFL